MSGRWEMRGRDLVYVWPDDRVTYAEDLMSPEQEAALVAAVRAAEQLAEVRQLVQEMNGPTYCPTCAVWRGGRRSHEAGCNVAALVALTEGDENDGQ